MTEDGFASWADKLAIAKKLFKVNAYIWVRISYLAFGYSSIYHLRITDVCDDGIRVEAPNNIRILQYCDYGNLWAAYDKEPQ